MVEQANWAADRLHLPASQPIKMSDVVDDYISRPWFSVIYDPRLHYLPETVFGTNIYNPSLPRTARLRALKFGLSGWIETTNFEFGFYQGVFSHVMRLDAPTVERYALRLDQLVGKPSLINDAQAHALALKWLAALDVDMAKLTQLKWTVHQLRYLPRGATNVVVLPIYYVDFGNLHFPASGNLHAFDEPMVSVEVLGTTKELQDVKINVQALYLCHRPLLLITNALDFIRTPNPQVKRLQPMQTNSPSP
ncbi:MAG: hypothetical protein ACREE6_02435 [Limisphaerales bacterium]